MQIPDSTAEGVQHQRRRFTVTGVEGRPTKVWDAIEVLAPNSHSVTPKGVREPSLLKPRPNDALYLLVVPLASRMRLRTRRYRQVELYAVSFRRLLESACELSARIHANGLDALPAYGVEKCLGKRPTLFVRHRRRHAPPRGLIVNGKREPRSVPSTQQRSDGVRV